jgi:hypothetical protein
MSDHGRMRLPFAVGLALIVTACSSLPPAPPTASPDMQARNKINLDLSQIDDQGMIGAAGAQRRAAYEFCVPDDASKLSAVRAIDPSVQCTLGTPGRIRCSRDQYLCIGEGGTRDTLLRLASLDFVERIDPFYGE